MEKIWLKTKNLSTLLKIMGLLLLAAIPFINIDILGILPDLCIYKNLTGKECWGCGMTRSFFALCSGKVVESIHFNWRIVIIFPVIVYLYIKKITGLLCKLVKN